MMTDIKTLTLKQHLLSIQAEHMAFNLQRPLSREVKQAIKAEVIGLLDQAEAVAQQINRAELQRAQMHTAMLHAMRRDPSKTVPEHYCTLQQRWLK